MTPVTNETCAQTAKRVRRALKERYPAVKFSVRSSTYAGGASIDARYVDGPPEREVWSFLQQFAGADFVASSLERLAYVDEAVEELGGSELGMAERIGLGQYAESMEVFASVAQSLRERADELENES